MARKPDRTAAGEPLMLHPWVLLVVGGLLSLISLLLASAGLPLVQLILAGVGLSLGVFAVSRKLKSTHWEVGNERFELSALLAMTALVGLAGWGGTIAEWDSVRLFLAAAVLVCLAGAMLVLLPSVGRRIVFSLLIVFHFVGLATAVTSIDPPNNTGPWLAKQMWMRVYRPYLSFLYMTNAYHFYSPDPGPPALMWFAVHYSDNTYRWVKLPDRDNSPVSMHYQRMLALPEHSFVQVPRLPYSRAELLDLQEGVRNQIMEAKSRGPSAGSEKEFKERLKLLEEELQRLQTTRPWEAILDQRQRASGARYQPPIPWVLDIDMAIQYRQPNDVSKRVLSSVARNVFVSAQQELDHAPKRDGEQALTVKTVKLYRVTHQVISPLELSKGLHPLDKTKYLPYFLGEYDGQGNLLDPDDPFLYWYLPIVKKQADYPRGFQDPITRLVSIRATAPAPKDGDMLDCMEIHAAGSGRSSKQEPGKP